MSEAVEAGAPDESWTAFRRDEGFTGLIGPFWFRRIEGAVVFGFRAAPRHCNPRGVVHGGMLMTLLDHNMGAQIWRETERKPSATISLTTDFVASARAGDWIEARTRITRRGTGLVFASAVLEAAGKPIATAQGVFKLLGER